jgi:putative ABC transport system permease protein
MVMKKLLLKLLRDIKEAKGQFIAIILVVLSGALFNAGLLTISNGLNSYTKKYYKAYNLSDLYVYYAKISPDNIIALEKLEGINKIEGRYTFEGTQSFDALKADLKIHSIPKNNEINKIAIVEGKLEVKRNEIIIDSRYGKAHNYNIGDRIKININKKMFEFKISGFCEDVEHAYNVKDATAIFPDHKAYGVGYISEDNISNILGSFYYNELIIDAKENYDMEKLSKEIESKSKYLPYLYQLTKERTVSFFAIDQNIKSTKSMSVILPIVMFIVAAIIIFLTMSRIINTQRNQIGIMKALGIKNSSIMIHYIGYSIFIVITGFIIGSILGFYIFIKVGAAQLGDRYSFPNLKLSIDIINILPNLIIAIVFSVISSYLSCRKILKECAAQAMRPRPPKRTKIILIERAHIVWRNISYSNKIILRNIFLTKQRSIFTSIGIIACIILLSISLGYINSTKYIRTQIDEFYKYDLRINYKNVIDFNTLKLPGDIAIEKKYAIEELPVEFKNSIENKDTILVVKAKENELIPDYNSDNKLIALDDAGVIISKGYADKYKLSKGDSLKLKFITPDLKGKSVDMKVSGISLQYLGEVIYCTPKYLESFSVTYKPTTLLVKLNNSNNVDKAYDFFNSDNQVYKIISKDFLKKAYDYNVDQSYSIMLAFVISAIILAGAAIYIVSSINIFERTRELATLKVLGYQKSKINKLVFEENIIITLFSLIISIPLSKYTYKLFSIALSKSEIVIPEKLSINPMLMAMTITLLVTVISNILLSRKVSKINMIESLKSIE